MTFNLKLISFMVCVLFVGLFVGKTVLGESAIQTQDEVICESCWEFSYVDHQSQVLIDGKEDGEFLPASSFIADQAGGNTYNHYDVKDVTSSATTIESSSTVSRDILTHVSIQGIKGSKVTTQITGQDDKLTSMIKTHLEMNGFNATIEPASTSQIGVSITYTEAQANAFFEGGDLTSFSSLSNTPKKDAFSNYAQAIKDALNEYHTQKNVWIWDSNSVAETPDQTIDFLTRHHVNHIYLHYNPLVEEHYPYFITKATENNMTVHALMGAPHWGLEVNIPEGKHRMDRVMEYNNNAPENGKFVGIHLDIEPHVLDEWDQDRTDMIQQWSNASQQYVQYARDNGFIVGSDLPFWTDGSSVEPYYPGFYKEMIDRNDYVTVMAYRNTALGSNSITSLSENEVFYENSPKVEVGIEVKPHYLDYVSFDDKTYLTMEDELAKVRDYYTDSQPNGFKGITYHSFTEWRNLENRK
ncbi:hypothetical protein GLW08_00635 [Pontibacillus yanchengensis]|uniref:Uncharacterized protein n=1 Tax=Pontibacillus yanchengensis TaxID=462910 RepID=A0ACC7VCI3_9BACI|nr:poly-gamma-glutamate hydrolase family protein [Pontibacillus yanchengensis]MYL51835.1 hypothetical protein [Pontibacillus yanchengensis]